MCLYPKLIKNRKYTVNKKNGGNVPPVLDERVRYVPIGCQKCMECKKQKARAWQVRLLEDLKEHKNGKFIALTFSDENYAKLAQEFPEAAGYDLDNEIATRATRLWLERWRKKYKKSLRHWLVTELGHNGTENIHMHGIVWTDKPLDEVENTWSYGFVWKGKEVKGRIQNYVNEQTVNYIIKYVTKMDEDHPNYNPIILTSPGIGRNYTTTGDYKNNQYRDGKTNEAYRTRTGHKMNMPIYWRNKIYSEEERERLWLQKLDKQERWILGQRVSVKDGDEEYLKGLVQAREINKRLGYGGQETSQEQEQYERDRRILMQKTRIEKAKLNEIDKKKNNNNKKKNKPSIEDICKELDIDVNNIEII